MDKELKPCPFCGSNNVDCDHEPNGVIFSIWCASCSVGIDHSITGGHVNLVERWNTRTPAAAAKPEEFTGYNDGGDFCANNAKKSDDAEREGLVGEIIKIIETRLLGVPHDDQDVMLEDCDWEVILTALRADHGELREALQNLTGSCLKTYEASGQSVLIAPAQDAYDEAIRALTQGSKT